METLLHNLYFGVQNKTSREVSLTCKLICCFIQLVTRTALVGVHRKEPRNVTQHAQPTIT